MGRFPSRAIALSLKLSRDEIQGFASHWGPVGVLLNRQMPS